MVVVDVIAQKTPLLEVRDGGLHHLVEDVVAPLHLLLEGDPGLLQEVGLDVAARQLTLDVEMDADKLALSFNDCSLKQIICAGISYKSGGVVISCSFRVTKGFKEWVGLDDLVLEGHLGVFLLALPGPDHGKVGDDLLGVLSLPRTRLAATKWK